MFTFGKKHCYVLNFRKDNFSGKAQFIDCPRDPFLSKATRLVPTALPDLIILNQQLFH